MVYTVKQLSDLAGVSVRTLHYYDEIGLLAPSRVGENGYRYYQDEQVFRLQQILLYREMDLSLSDIKAIVDEAGFDALAALQAHREALRARMHRLEGLIQTVDTTIAYLTGDVEMSDKRQLFGDMTKEDEERYEREAREQYGDEEVSASYKLWNNYSAHKQQQIKDEGNTIYTDLAKLIDAGKEPTSPEVQQVIGRWHQHMRYFYEPSVARLRGLGQLYVDSPDFAKNFRKVHARLPEFMQEAINIYCDAQAEK